MQWVCFDRYSLLFCDVHEQQSDVYTTLHYAYRCAVSCYGGIADILSEEKNSRM